MSIKVTPPSLWKKIGTTLKPIITGTGITTDTNSWRLGSPVEDNNLTLDPDRYIAVTIDGVDYYLGLVANPINNLLTEDQEPILTEAGDYIDY